MQFKLYLKWLNDPKRRNLYLYSLAKILAFKKKHKQQSYANSQKNNSSITDKSPLANLKYKKREKN